MVAVALLAAPAAAGAAEELDWNSFVRPPMKNRPWCYHHWINGNVDKATLTADLEDMKALGFGGVNMIDSRGYWDDSPDHVKVPPVDIVWGTEKWYDMVEHEMRECARLGLEFTMNAACSGGTLSRQVGDRVVETDVTNRDAVSAHLDAAIGPLLKRCPDLIGTTFTHIYSVSYEGKKAGGSWRKVKDTFYAAMTEWAHEHGLKVYSESGGPWEWGAKGVQLDCSQVDMLAVNDFPQGEFWPLSSYTEGGKGVRHANANIRLFNRGVVLGARQAKSRIVSAEAFTHMLHHYSVDPSVLKPVGDVAFADGVNRLVWHVYACSPERFGVPGAEYFAGSHINRHVTWHDDASAFIGYLGRCQYLLQSGESVDDGEFVDDVHDYYGWGRFRKDAKAPFTTTHRKIGDADVFFVAGEGRGALRLNAPIDGRSVEIWDAVTATRRPAEVTDGKVQLDLPIGGSCFVVVRTKNSASDKTGLVSHSHSHSELPLSGPWDVSFAYRPGVTAAPPAPMNMTSLVEWTTLDALRDFGGTATYRTSFTCGTAKQAILSVGELPSGTARVYVNGIDCGVAWCYPFEVDVSKALKPGTNALEIRYSNNWHNRLTADAGLPEGERVTRSVFRYSDKPRKGEGQWKARPTIWSGPAVGDARQKSGLLGPVALRTPADWQFVSAPLAKNPATGREIAPGVRELRVPDRGGCGWWTTTAAVTPHAGARFRATVEIAPDEAKDFVYNDFMMFVRWDYPKASKVRNKFYQRDFIAYTDRPADGKIVRTFDGTFAVPGESDSVEIEFIGKWHAMTATIRDVRVETVARPKPRVVRCVVGNPYESTGNRLIDARRNAGETMTGEKTMAVHLAQIETCLTNIFAKVAHPDIILFSECLAQQGARDPAEVAEAIPGGPSWKLAEKYAVRYRCNIAMNVKERDEEGRCHNTVFVCDRQGRLAGRYRKVHLTSGEYQQGLVPGDGFPLFDLDFGRVGALVCWDNWFSESIKLAKRNGAELLLFPLAGCAQDHVDTVFPARAIDAGIPILVAMRQHHLPNGIIDRDGTWIAKTFEDCGFAVADLDLNDRKRTFWLSVGPGYGDPYELYYDESRPEVYEKFNWRNPR